MRKMSIITCAFLFFFSIPANSGQDVTFETKTGKLYIPKVIIEGEAYEAILQLKNTCFELDEIKPFSGFIPNGALAQQGYIRFSTPPEHYDAVVAHVIAATLEKNYTTPPTALIYMDYLRLIEETSTSEVVVESKEYNSPADDIQSYGGGVYTRSPKWFDNDDHDKGIPNSSIQNGSILLIDASQTTDNLLHWWTNKVQSNPKSKYHIKSRFKIEGDVAIQFGVDYWLDLNVPKKGSSWNCNHEEDSNCLAWKSNWYGDTDGEFKTVTIPF